MDGILNYLTDNWSEKEIIDFKTALFKRVDLIGKYPKLFPPSDIQPSIRRTVLSKQTSIFYLVDSDKRTISIIRLFDNRMDPKSF